MTNRLEHALEASIFSSRWLQAPLYIGLVLVQIVSCWKFGGELPRGQRLIRLRRPQGTMVNTMGHAAKRALDS